MTTLQEIQDALSNPKNETGFFDPATGDAVFAENHEAAGILSANNALNGFQEELAKLEATEQELANAEGEARKPKPTMEVGPDGAPIQKGQSGKEMTETAVEEVGTTREEIERKKAELTKKINETKALVEHFAKKDTIKKYREGMFLLTISPKAMTDAQGKPITDAAGKQVEQRMWHVWSHTPSGLNSANAKQFLSNMQAAVNGPIAVVAHNTSEVLDATTATSIDDFINAILQKSASMLNSVSPLWLRRAGFKRVTWFL